MFDLDILGPHADQKCICKLIDLQRTGTSKIRSRGQG